MPHIVDLQAERRTAIGKRLPALRASGYVVANVYGAGLASIPIQFNTKTFHEIVRHVTPTTLINLRIDSENEPRRVYLREIQWQWTKREPFHVDFYAVNLNRRDYPFTRAVLCYPVSKLDTFVKILGRIDV